MRFETLIVETISLLVREKEINAQVIRNLIILFENKVHLEMGFPSFFVFCVERLRMCEATAYRKIAIESGTRSGSKIGLEKA